MVDFETIRFIAFVTKLTDASVYQFVSLSELTADDDNIEQIVYNDSEKIIDKDGYAHYPVVLTKSINDCSCDVFKTKCKNGYAFDSSDSADIFVLDVVITPDDCQFVELTRLGNTFDTNVIIKNGSWYIV